MIDPELYRSEDVFRRIKTEIFPESWTFLTHQAAIGEGLHPISLNDEPLILSRTDSLSCFSNVCTHRGSILLEAPCPVQNIRCPYHGRRFDPRGKFLSMPEFEGVPNFPSERDDLPEVQLGTWGPLIFASIDPALSFADWIAPLPDLGALTFTEERTYEFDANWALYCDNYLEGFHIPFVHPELAGALDYSSYRTETFDHASVQIGVAKDPNEADSLYFFLFPSTMVNVYPWGISLNVIEPLGIARTRVRFLTFVGDASKQSAASSDLHLVEMQDEAIVLSVQRGIRSRLYRGGETSPKRELAVRHFHELLDRYLSRAR
jgi:choline monooxygenase